MTEQLLDMLAELEHIQWMEWAGSILKSELISTKRKDRWLELIRPYEALTEKQKEQDRKYARRVIRALRLKVK